MEVNIYKKDEDLSTKDGPEIQLPRIPFACLSENTHNKALETLEAKHRQPRRFGM